MLPAQGHFRPLFKYQPNVFLIVLAAKTEQLALLLLCEHEFLKCQSVRFETNALGPILAADARPKGMIAIQNDYFAWRTAQSMEFARNAGGQRAEKDRCI